MDGHVGKHQCWMMRILPAGVGSAEDFNQLYQSNHVLEVALELLQSSVLDTQVEQAYRRFMVTWLKMAGGSLANKLKDERGSAQFQNKWPL